MKFDFVMNLCYYLHCSEPGNTDNNRKVAIADKPKTEAVDDIEVNTSCFIINLYLAVAHLIWVLIYACINVQMEI